MNLLPSILMETRIVLWHADMVSLALNNHIAFLGSTVPEPLANEEAELLVMGEVGVFIEMETESAGGFFRLPDNCQQAARIILTFPGLLTTAAAP
jgi:hypothetical protein